MKLSSNKSELSLPQVLPTPTGSGLQIMEVFLGQAEMLPLIETRPFSIRKRTKELLIKHARLPTTESDPWWIQPRTACTDQSVQGRSFCGPTWGCHTCNKAFVPPEGGGRTNCHIIRLLQPSQKGRWTHTGQVPHYDREKQSSDTHVPLVSPANDPKNWWHTKSVYF